MSASRDIETLRNYMLKEVDLIQDVIKRMANNSFLIKGWALTLVVASLLLKVPRYESWIAFIPLLMFWILDAYFLRQERLYRELHNWVVTNRLKTDEHLFDLDARRFEKKVESKYRIMLSTTLIWFYGLIGTLIVIYVIVSFVGIGWWRCFG
jgi:hypothetical protein